MFLVRFITSNKIGQIKYQIANQNRLQLIDSNHNQNQDKIYCKIFDQIYFQIENTVGIQIRDQFIPLVSIRIERAIKFKIMSETV